MITPTIGDLSMVFHNRLGNTRLRSELERLGNELTSGRTSDLGARTGGELGNYAAIENALRSLESYKIAASEAAHFADTLQRGLGVVQDQTAEIGPALLLASSTQEATLVQSAATDAKARLSTVVSVLNTRVADRALLGGTDIGALPLTDADTMLTALKTAIVGETSAAGIEAVVEAWFDDPGGGFETVGYQGSTDDLAPFRVGPDEEVEISIRADTAAFRDLLKGYAMAALVADGALSGNNVERVAMIENAATRLLTSDKAMAEIRAGLGAAEARIDTAIARNEAESAALEIARSDIVRVDPYKTATELQTVEAQLETLYAITARLSRLSLVEYLR